MTPTSSSVRTGTSCVRSPAAAFSVTSLKPETDLRILLMMNQANAHAKLTPTTSPTMSTHCPALAAVASLSKLRFCVFMVDAPISASAAIRGASMLEYWESTDMGSLPDRVASSISLPFCS